MIYLNSSIFFATGEVSDMKKTDPVVTLLESRFLFKQARD